MTGSYCCDIHNDNLGFDNFGFCLVYCYSLNWKLGYLKYIYIYICNIVILPSIIFYAVFE